LNDSNKEIRSNSGYLFRNFHSSREKWN